MTSFLKEFFQNYLTLYSLLFFIYAVGFTLLSSFFHYKNLEKKHTDDLQVFIRYFIYFCLFLLIIPAITIFLYVSQPFEALKSFGFQFGNYKPGLLLCLIAIPVCAIAVFVSLKDPKLKNQYPFSKNACRSRKTFVLYELAYLLFYYFAWEFTFRGVFLFSIIEMTGEAKSGILIAILIQATIATIYHLGHPDIEVVSAFVGSIIFGIIAYLTKSFLYTLFIHALLGMANDTFFYLKYHKAKFISGK
ncbi:MAG: CPBP family intramembrane metalloprotease [Candidatus Aminicenantes bacterium]|nr:MAG: CPBP family intramembrane metalloprotease [Candidatus Aminicenantes bacterium]